MVIGDSSENKGQSQRVLHNLSRLPEAEKEMNMICRVCGKEFETGVVPAMRVGGVLIREEGTEVDCPRCQKKIKAVNWFGHHNKPPTTKLLDKELQKVIKDLVLLLEGAQDGD